MKYKIFGCRRLRKDAHLSAYIANSKAGTSFPEFGHKFHNPGEKVTAACIVANYFYKEDLYAHRSRSAMQALFGRQDLWLNVF